MRIEMTTTTTMMMRITLELVPLTIIMRMLILSIADHTMMLVTILLHNIKEEGIKKPYQDFDMRVDIPEFKWKM